MLQLTSPKQVTLEQEYNNLQLLADKRRLRPIFDQQTTGIYYKAIKRTNILRQYAISYHRLRSIRNDLIRIEHCQAFNRTARDTTSAWVKTHNN
jgi:hypothetical protein